MEWDCFLKSLCTCGGPMGQLLRAIATHSSTLAWKIPGTEEPHRLQSMGSRRVVHDWSNLAAAAAWVNLQTDHWNSRSELSAHSHDLEVLYWVELRLERLPGKRNTCVFQIICSWQRGLKLTEHHFGWSRQFSRFSYRMLRAADTFVSTGVRQLGMDVWVFFSSWYKESLIALLWCLTIGRAAVGSRRDHWEGTCFPPGVGGGFKFGKLLCERGAGRSCCCRLPGFWETRFVKLT